MFLEYHIPETIEEALRLLERPHPPTVVMGGGAYLEQVTEQDFAVVDIKKLGLDKILHRGVNLEVGSAVPLTKLVQDEQVSPKMSEVVRWEAEATKGKDATIAGTLVVADGSSPLATVLLAMDARLTLLPGEGETFIGDFLPFRKDLLAGRLITRIAFPVNISFTFNFLSHDADYRPWVGVGVARWPSGRTRVALSGYGAAPILAFDSPEASGIIYAVEDAFSRAGDGRASTEDRQAAVVKLTQEGLAMLNSTESSPPSE